MCDIIETNFFRFSVEQYEYFILVYVNQFTSYYSVYKILS